MEQGLKMDKSGALVVFQDKKIRRIWYQEEWWFSVVDVIAVLTESFRARKYWSDLKLKLRQEENFEMSDIIGQLKLPAPDGKLRETDCANVETLFRIIQSIPSPKANTFKLWLARVGYERVQEIENPELAQDRAKTYYELKGYPQDWIDKRLRGIAVRQSLTEEWRVRGIKEQKDFAILTAEISKATFGMTPAEYKEFKNLPSQSKVNLRDHMDDLELIFTMLGEASTTRIAKNKDAQGFSKNKEVAQKGGGIAGTARKILELESKEKVSKSENYLLHKPKKKLTK